MFLIFAAALRELLPSFNVLIHHPSTVGTASARNPADSDDEDVGDDRHLVLVSYINALTLAAAVLPAHPNVRLLSVGGAWLSAECRLAALLVISSPFPPFVAVVGATVAHGSGRPARGCGDGPGGNLPGTPRRDGGALLALTVVRDHAGIAGGKAAARIPTGTVYVGTRVLGLLCPAAVGITVRLYGVLLDRLLCLWVYRESTLVARWAWRVEG